MGDRDATRAGRVLEASAGLFATNFPAAAIVFRSSLLADEITGSCPALWAQLRRRWQGAPVLSRTHELLLLSVPQRKRPDRETLPLSQ